MCGHNNPAEHRTNENYKALSDSTVKALEAASTLRPASQRRNEFGLIGFATDGVPSKRLSNHLRWHLKKTSKRGLGSPGARSKIRRLRLQVNVLWQNNVFGFVLWIPFSNKSTNSDCVCATAI
jgi:hypothetical protein